MHSIGSSIALKHRNYKGKHYLLQCKSTGIISQLCPNRFGSAFSGSEQNTCRNQRTLCSAEPISVCKPIIVFECWTIMQLGRVVISGCIWGSGDREPTSCPSAMWCTTLHGSFGIRTQWAALITHRIMQKILGELMVVVVEETITGKSLIFYGPPTFHIQ